jgi:hypothetical protein
VWAADGLPDLAVITSLPCDVLRFPLVAGLSRYSQLVTAQRKNIQLYKRRLLGKYLVEELLGTIQHEKIGNWSISGLLPCLPEDSPVPRSCETSAATSAEQAKIGQKSRVSRPSDF